MKNRSNRFKWFAPLQVFLFNCFLPFAILFSASAAADFSNEVIITASDGANGDDFGHSVSIDGDSLLVGAFDDNSTGSAYVYVRNPATDTWSLQQKIPAPPGSGGMDWFGYSVSISGDTALIGVGRDDDQAENSGSAYVYVRDPATGTWTEQQKLLPSDGVFRGYFGNAVYVNGDTAVVGATGVGAGRGAAYVFVRDPATDTWSEQQKLVATGVTANFDSFGTAVFVEGDQAIVGATGNDEGATDAGAAYVFVRDGTDTWNLEQKLLASDAGFSDAFGVAVNLSGDTALVGAFMDADLGSAAGSAYIFVRDPGTGNWTEQQKLLASDGTSFRHFGRSVALDGDMAIVGAARGSAAYVNMRDLGTGVWTEAQKVSVPPSTNDYALSISLSGNTLAVGARGELNKGAVFVYTSAVPKYSVEGTVSGLTALGLVLQNNGGDNLDVFTNGSFLFSTQLDDGNAYDVTVLTNPPGQTCSVTNGSGTISGANVTNVIVTCADDQVATYTVGGTVSGLSGTGLVLQNNTADDLPVAADGSFTFVTALADGSAYAVSVLTQPTSPNQTCTVGNGSGTLAGANVTNVTVTCVTDVVPTYTVGGTVSGLSGTGLVLQNNTADDLPVAADGSFTFVTALADGSAYAVSVLTQPTSPNQTCTVSNGSGTLAGANVTDVSVTCVTTTYTVGGMVSGLNGTGLVLQNNTADDLPVAADGSFTFANAMADGSAYAITILSQPTGQTCVVNNGSGTVTGTDVIDVDVTCVDDVTAPPPPPPIPMVPIPTLSGWALILFSLLLALVVFANRRRLF